MGNYLGAHWLGELSFPFVASPSQHPNGERFSRCSGDLTVTPVPVSPSRRCVVNDAGELMGRGDYRLSFFQEGPFQRTEDKQTTLDMRH